MRTGRLLVFFSLVAVAAPLSGQSPDAFASMQAREIGPAGMSGRVSDVEVVLSDPNIVYVGGSTGGLFKSLDGGHHLGPDLRRAEYARNRLHCCVPAESGYRLGGNRGRQPTK